MLEIILLFLLTYLLAAIPSGYWIGKIFGKDLLAEGSGSTGATNVFRMVGKWQAVFVLVFDILKGFVPIYFAKNFVSYMQIPQNLWLFLLLTFIPILAHSKSIYIGFRGGKSSATGIGVLFALNPLVGLITFAIWGITVFVSGISSLGSIVSAPLVPVWLWIFDENWAVIGFGVVAFVYIVLIKHKENIKRLIAGKEYNFRADKYN